MARSSSSRRRSCCSPAYAYENTRLLLLSKSRAFPNGLSNNHGQVGRHYFSHAKGGGGHGAVPVRPEQLVRPAGAGRRRGRVRRRQLRSRRARLHRRRQPLGLFGPAADWRRQHDHVRPRARRGARSGRRSSRRTPTASTAPTSRRRRCRTRRTCLDLDPVVKDPLGFPVMPHHRRVPGQRTAHRRRSSRTRWSSGIAPPARSAVAAQSARHRWDRRRTPTAARAWATTPRRTS